jgi:polyketide synthase PksL
MALARMLVKKPIHSLKVLKQELANRILTQLPNIIQSEIDMHKTVFSHPDVVEVKKCIDYYFNKPEGRQHLAKTKDETEVERIKPGRKIVLKTKGDRLLSANQNQIEESVEPAAPMGEKLAKTTVKDKLFNIVSKVLHVPKAELDAETVFRDLGMDSISGVELIRDVNRAFNLNLESVVIYNSPNIKKLMQLAIEELDNRNCFSQIVNPPTNQPATARPVEIDIDDLKIPDNGKDEEILDLLKRLKTAEINIDEVDQFLEKML